MAGRGIAIESVEGLGGARHRQVAVDVADLEALGDRACEGTVGRREGHHCKITGIQPAGARVRAVGASRGCRSLCSPCKQCQKTNKIYQNIHI